MGEVIPALRATPLTRGFAEKVFYVEKTFPRSLKSKKMHGGLLVCQIIARMRAVKFFE